MKKKFYMNLEPQEEHNNINTLKKELKAEIKEQPFDIAIEKLTDQIDISVTGGVAHISMPEPLLMVATMMLKKIELLNNNNLNLDRGIQR